MFRIAQEAVSNIRKHSQATEALIRIEFLANSVKLTVSDNGVGFRVPPLLSDFAGKAKLGLMGMQERTRLLNGTFLIDSDAGKGTTITVEAEL